MGRPKKYNNEEELQLLIDEYFDECDSRTKTVVTKSGGIIKVDNPKPYTVEGLAAHLEIDRRTILNYEKEKGYEQFFPTIKKAKNRILANLMERGLDGDNAPAMTIFNLKNNYDYKDKREVETTNTHKLDVEKPDIEDSGFLEKWEQSRHIDEA